MVCSAKAKTTNHKCFILHDLRFRGVEDGPDHASQVGLELLDRRKTQHSLVLVMALCTLGLQPNFRTGDAKPVFFDPWQAGKRPFRS